MNLTYKIEFFSYWHAGSGLAGSTYADSIVNKNTHGLPYIPGKTLKGLLRDAAEKINSYNNELISKEFITKVFGARAEEGNTNYQEEGSAFFTNAGLSKGLSEEIMKSELVNELYKVISSTKIDENGQAKEGSLRQLEVTIPLTLYGTIEQLDGSIFKEEITMCFDWIKQMGQGRNRGLGKCKFSIVK